MKVPLPYVNIYEKRLLPRYVTFLPIELYKKINDKKDKSPISIKIINLSKNGVSFCAKEELKPSQELDFKILDNSSLLIEGSGKIIWHKHIKNDNSYLYGFQFIRLRKRDDNKLKELLKSISINSTDKAPIKFESQPYGMMCREMYGVDLSIGCKYKCLYCHFSRLKADQDPNHAGELLDITPIHKMKHFPSPIYLSPYSDCFTDQTRDLSHAFLEYLLPKGVEFWILTKGIIPTRTLNLIRKYSNQIELCVGITNLSNRRNAILENGAPTVKERLESIPKLHSTGCRVGARMDPIFPKIDDDPKDLEKILKRLSRYGIKEIAASYLFITAAQIRILKKEPFLTESLALFTEKSPTTGGNAFTLPFAEKLIRYKRMANLCSKYGIKLFVCGCKELRLQQEDGYSLACR